jgi:hypothetical protein
VQVLEQLKRISAIVLAAAVLASTAACGRSETADDAVLPAKQPGIARLPSEFTNLEVLPADITKDELKREMKLMTRSLGVKCDYCHRTDIEDYATDEIDEKVVARKMMRMVERINRQHFTWPEAPEATCFMCHHGEPVPQLAPEARLAADGSENL